MSQSEESKMLDIPVFCDLEELREKLVLIKNFFIKYCIQMTNCTKK